MNQEKDKKVAIVGAGIIGLYLAWKLREKGNEVVVFEKKNKIGRKVCSGLISERLKDFIPLKTSFIEHKINFCLIHFPRKTVTLKLKPVHLVINREELSKELLRDAEKSGARVLFNQEIKEIPKGFDRIIGCDGALSVVREKAGLQKSNFRMGLQFFQKSKDYSDFVETWPVGSGFFWKIPRGEEIEYGAMGDVPFVKKDFQKFCAKQGINIEKVKLYSALIPQGLCLQKSQNIALCGDALGLTKPWSGGGVIWGLSASDLLIKNFPDFEKYHKEVHNFFAPKIFKGKLGALLVGFFGKNFPFILPSKFTRDNDFPLLF